MKTPSKLANKSILDCFTGGITGVLPWESPILDGSAPGRTATPPRFAARAAQSGCFHHAAKRWLLALGLCSSLAAYGHTDARLEHYLSLSLEELAAMEVSISTDTRQPLSQAPAVVTVITAADIKATGSTNLAEILESVPGINIRASQFANRPLVHFRGANASQTLLMIDGAPLKDLMWGFGIFWKGLPTSMIERVEIIRGPGSALFGADASSGVINVITKTAGTIEHTQAGVRAGSFGSKSVWGQYGGEWNGFDVGFTVDLQSTDGHDPFIPADGQTANDRADGTQVSFAPDSARYGWKNADLRFSVARDNWRLQADYMAHDDLETGLTGAGVLDPLTSADDSRYGLGLFYENDTFHDDWRFNAEVRFQHLSYSSDGGFLERPPGFTGSYPNGVLNHMSSSERQLTLEASGQYAGFDDHAILLGAGYNWQDLYRVEHLVNSGTGPDGNPLPTDGPVVDISDTPYAFAPEKARNIRYLYLQDEWTLAEDWKLTAGARYDDYSDFGDTLNPRLALVWQSTEKLTTKLMFGQAFRAPSYQELFSETSFTLPNPQLNPERSQTWELSFAYAASRDLHLNLSLFHLYQEDLIRAVAMPGLSKRQFQNTGNHTIQGVEVEAFWQATADLRFSGNFSIRGQADSEFRAVGVPDRDAYLRADWRFLPHWNWNLQGNWLGERSRRDSDKRQSVDDYLWVDSTLRYGGWKDWDLAVSVRNLLDEDARDYTGASIPDDLPLPGRSVYAEACYKF
jgi:outer membrane receptor protein involved in Fe transport